MQQESWRKVGESSRRFLVKEYPSSELTWSEKCCLSRRTSPFEDSCSRSSMIFLLKRTPFFVTKRTKSTEEYHVLDCASREEIYTPLGRKTWSPRQCKRSANGLHQILGIEKEILRNDAIAVPAILGYVAPNWKWTTKWKSKCYLFVYRSRGPLLNTKQINRLGQWRPITFGLTPTTRNNHQKTQLQPRSLITGQSFEIVQKLHPSQNTVLLAPVSYKKQMPLPSGFQTYQKSTSIRSFANNWKTWNHLPDNGESACTWAGWAPYVFLKRLNTANDLMTRAAR